MFVLAKRLKNMKRHLRNMNRVNGNVFNKVKMLRIELKKVQQCLDKEPDNSRIREEEFVYCKAYQEAVRDEVNLLRQKTKIQWLKDGDFNTSYFHNMLKSRVNKSRIHVVSDEQGNKFYGDEVPGCFVKHFEQFLGVADEVIPLDDCEGLFTKKLDPAVAVNMIRPITDSEIKEAMFSIDDDKAAGPDGFTYKFFKAAWSVVSGDVYAAVKEFFSSGKLLGEFNTNVISLIPKLQVPLKVQIIVLLLVGMLSTSALVKSLLIGLKKVLAALLIVTRVRSFREGRLVTTSCWLRSS